MSIRFITGKPGSGKGVVTTDQIIMELKEGDRPVIAFFALKFDPWVRTWKKLGKVHMKPEIGMKAYLQHEYKTDFDLSCRVHLLDEDQASEFFLFRVVDGKLVKAECERDQNGSITDFDHDLGKQAGGCLYVVDEAWKFYSSRNFAKTGKGFLGYVPLNRHFGDDVLIVTQHTKQIEVACQRVAQDFWVVTNHGKLPLGPFRQPDVFTVAIYDQPPTGAMVQALSRKVFRLDKAGIGSCFDTAGGLSGAGAVGSAGDLFERRRGLPWWAILLLIVAIALASIKITAVMGWLTGHAVKTPQQHPAHTVGPVPVVPSQSGPPKPENVLPALEKQEDAGEVRTNETWCTGWIKLGSEYVATLSDGNSYSSADHELDWIQKRKISILGKIYDIRPGVASSEYQPAPLPEYSGVVTPRAEPYVQVIPFGQRNRPTQLPNGQSQKPMLQNGADIGSGGP